MLLQNCLLDQIDSETSLPPLHLYFVGSQDLCSTIFVTFQNWQSEIYTHFMSRLASCVEVGMEPGFECLSFFILYSTICHFSCEVQHYDCRLVETESENEHS